MTQISWQYQVNNRAGGYIVTNTDWNDVAGDLRAFIDQTTSSTTDNTPLPIGIDLTNDRVYISDPDSTTPEDGNHADTTLSVVGTTTLAGNTQQTGTFTVGVDDTGHDVKFFGATSGAYMLWDESDDELLIDGGAKIGIGTTAPQCPLVVRDQSNDTVSLLLRANNDGTVVGKTYLAINPYDSSSDTHMGTMIGAEEYDAADRRAHMTFWTRGSNSHVAPTERMRITSAGRVAINETSPGALLQVSGDGAGAEVCARFADPDSTVTASNVISQFWFTGDGTATGGYFIEFRDQTAVIGSVTCAGAAAVAFNTTSDYRLKSNVTDLTDAVTSVEALRPVTFNFERDPDELTHLGFLAHEVAEVCPSAVTGDKDAMNPAVDAVVDDDGNVIEPAQPESIKPQMMDASKLVPLLTAAVQELTVRIAALEAA